MTMNINDNTDYEPSKVEADVLLKAVF